MLSPRTSVLSLQRHLANTNEAHRVLDYGGRILLFFDGAGNASPCAPISDPGDLLDGRRHQARQSQLAQATLDEREDLLSLLHKYSRIERHRIGTPIRQRREFGKSLGIIKNADDPEVVELALGSTRIFGHKLEGKACARLVQQDDFIGSQITGDDFPTELHRFHSQERDLGDTGSDIEAPSSRTQTSEQYFRELDAQRLARPSAILPEFISSLVAVNGSQARIVQTVEDL